MVLKTFKRNIWMQIRKVFVPNEEEFTPHGVVVKIPKDADIGIRYSLALGRPYEAPEADMVVKYLSDGQNVIELGGCYGIISALIRKQIGPDAKHIIVEANPALSKICAINANLENTNNRADLVVAAIDYSGAKEICFAQGQNPHDGHIANSGEHGFPISTTTLAEQIKKLPSEEYILVCDIEGAELELSINEKKALSKAYLIILETHADMYPRKNLDYGKMKKNIESAGLIEIEKSGAVVCFASQKALKDFNFI